GARLLRLFALTRIRARALFPFALEQRIELRHADRARLVVRRRAQRLDRERLDGRAARAVLAFEPLRRDLQDLLERFFERRVAPALVALPCRHDLPASSYHARPAPIRW